MQALKWSRDGWVKNNTPRVSGVKKDFNGRVYNPIRSLISDVKEDFDSQSSNPEVREIRLAEQEIPFGNTQAFLDTMTASTQFVYRDPYLWFTSGNNMFKARDPEDQARDDQFSDPEDKWKCSKLYKGVSLATTLYLEESNLLGPDPERDYDVMDMFNDDEFQLGGTMSHDQSVSVENIGSLGLIGEVDSDLEDWEIPPEEEDFNYCSVDTYIPSFPDEVSDKVDALVEEFYSRTNNLSLEEIIPIRREIEIKIDQLVYQYLVNSFSTCTRYGRFSAPKTKYDYIFNVDNSSWKTAADERKDTFAAKIKSITACKSMNDLFGELHIDEDGKSQRGGGVFGKLHEMYAQDKALLAEWNEEAFATQRAEYITKLREQNVDEETIRIKVYAAYDRISGVAEAEYDDNGKLSSETTKWSDSYWRQNKTSALMNLNFTSNQWKAIFAAKDLMTYRFKLTEKTKTEEEKNWTKLIHNSFGKIDNISQFLTFKNWLYERESLQYYINSGNKSVEFGRAPIDNLSIIQQKNLENAMVKVKDAILSQVKESNSKDIESFTEVNIEFPEIYINCYHLNGDHGCNAENYQSPKFILTSEDKGLLFITCESCGKKVFVRENFAIVEKTLAEWVEFIQEN